LRGRVRDRGKDAPSGRRPVAQPGPADQVLAWYEPAHARVAAVASVIAEDEVLTLGNRERCAVGRVRNAGRKSYVGLVEWQTVHEDAATIDQELITRQTDDALDEVDLLEVVGRTEDGDVAALWTAE